MSLAMTCIVPLASAGATEAPLRQRWKSALRTMFPKDAGTGGSVPNGISQTSDVDGFVQGTATHPAQKVSDVAERSGTADKYETVPPSWIEFECASIQLHAVHTRHHQVRYDDIRRVGSGEPTYGLVCGGQVLADHLVTAERASIAGEHR